MAQNPQEVLSGKSPTPYEGEDVTNPIPSSEEQLSLVHPRAAKKPWHMPAPTTRRQYKSPYTDALIDDHPRIIYAPKSPRELLEIAERGRRGARPIPSTYYNKQMTYFGKSVNKPTWGELIGAHHFRENFIQMGMISPVTIGRNPDDPDFNSKEALVGIMEEMTEVHGWASIARTFTDRSIETILDTTNQKDFDNVFQRIVQIMSYKEIQDSGGFWAGLIANVLIAPFDPINYIPLGIVSGPARVLGRAVKSAIKKPRSLLAKQLDHTLHGARQSRHFALSEKGMVDGGDAAYLRKIGFKGPMDSEDAHRLADARFQWNPSKPRQTGPQEFIGPRPSPNHPIAGAAAGAAGFSIGGLALKTGKVLISRTGFGRAVVAATPPILLSEAALQNLDPQRTADETSMNIGATIIFSWGLLGLVDFSRFISKSRSRNNFGPSGGSLIDEAGNPYDSGNPSGLLSDIPTIVSPSDISSGRNLWGGHKLPESAEIQKRTKELDDFVTDTEKALKQIDQELELAGADVGAGVTYTSKGASSQSPVERAKIDKLFKRKEELTKKLKRANDMVKNWKESLPQGLNARIKKFAAGLNNLRKMRGETQEADWRDVEVDNRPEVVLGVAEWKIGVKRKEGDLTNLATRPVYVKDDKGNVTVNTMRTAAAQPGEHFGNPFSPMTISGTHKVGTTAEAISFYSRWLSDTWGPLKGDSAKTIDKLQKAEAWAKNNTNIIKQREWILGEMKGKKLKGARLLYSKRIHEANKAKPGVGPDKASHAQVLAGFASTRPGMQKETVISKSWLKLIDPDGTIGVYYIWNSVRREGGTPDEALFRIEREYRKEILKLKKQLRSQYQWRVIERDVSDFGSGNIGILVDNQFTSKQDMIRRMAAVYYMIDNNIELHRNAIPILREYSVYNRMMEGDTAPEIREAIISTLEQKDILTGSGGRGALGKQVGGSFMGIGIDWDKILGPWLRGKDMFAHRRDPGADLDEAKAKRPEVVKFFANIEKFVRNYINTSDTAAGKFKLHIGNMEDIAEGIGLSSRDLSTTLGMVVGRGEAKVEVDADKYWQELSADPNDMSVDLNRGFKPLIAKEDPVHLIIDIAKIHRSWKNQGWVHGSGHYSTYSTSSEKTMGLDLLAFGGRLTMLPKVKLLAGMQAVVFDSPRAEADSFLRYLSYVIEHEMMHVDQKFTRGGTESFIATDRLGRRYNDRDIYPSQVPLENATNYAAYVKAVGQEVEGSASPFAPSSQTSREPGTDGVVINGENLRHDNENAVSNFLSDKPSHRARLLSRHYGIDEHTTGEIVKGGLGNKIVQWMTKVANPGFQIADSPSAIMRGIVPQLINTPWFYKNEMEGFTNGSSVQARASAYVGYVHQALRHHKVHFSNWRSRIAKERNLWMGGKFNFKINEEFNGLVGQAMRANRIAKGIGDPDVLDSARAFRDNVYDPMLKHLVNVGAVDPDSIKSMIELNGSYYHRVYNKIKLGESKSEFINHIASYFENVSKLSKSQSFEAATNTYSKLMSSPDGSHLPGDISVRGANRERTLDIPDEYLEDWLVDDIELVSMNYTKTWGTDIELRRTFGDPSMALQIASIKKDFDGLIKEWSSRSGEEAENAVIKLEEAKVDHIEKLKGIRDKMRGMDDLPADPSSILHRLPGVIRGFAYSAQSGSFLLSNIPDMANTVAFYGLNRTFGSGWIPYIDNFANLSMTRDQASSLAIAIERVKGPVLAEMIGTQSVYGRPMSRSTNNSSLFHRAFDKVESTSYKAAQISNSLNLMAPWADVCQMVNYLVSQDFILEAALNASKGKAIGNLDMAKLAKLGLDKDSLSKIWSEFDKYGLMEGKEKNIPVANMKEWKDSDTLLKFQAAIKTAQDLTNMAPGPGDRPLALTGPWGKLATMYWGFGFASMSRIGVQRMQLKDQAAIQGTMMQLGLGAMVVYLKHIASGESWDEAPDNMIANTVDKSGLLGWLANADILLGIASNGTVGLNAWTNHPNAEFSIEAMLRAALGPGGSFIESTAKSMFGIPIDLLTSGKLSSGTVSDLRNTIPWTKLFYLQSLFNLIDAAEGSEEESNNDRFDLR